MEIKLSDIYRATLSSKSGNEGWIGLEPSGKTYHVIVPVDPQIARGVMACNRPNDGTPFGGYTGWVYFRCEPFDADDDASEQEQRKIMAKRNMTRLVEFASTFGITSILVEDIAKERESQSTACVASLHQKIGKYVEHGFKARTPSDTDILKCTECSVTWNNLARLLSDPSVTFYLYRANTTDFRKGYFVFHHTCGGLLEVLVAKLGRSRYAGRSLAGSHACPGFCYYEASLSECSAVCEGSVFRRIAGRLKTRGGSAG